MAGTSSMNEAESIVTTPGLSQDLPLLYIAETLSLPASVVTESISVFGRKGSGKTYAAKVLAEEMIGAGVQIVVLDPLGVWWGLRSAADGEHEGVPIVVLGGAHGDLPLDPSSATALADLVVREGVSVVLSLDYMDAEDEERFVFTFCERLFQLKRQEVHRQPLHVFIDEADTYAPEHAGRNKRKTLGAIAALVRRGRVFGIGVTLITQRNAAIAKDVTNQSGVLIALKTSGTNDQAPLAAWVSTNDSHGLGPEFLASLASLPVGTAWVWSPDLDLFRKVQIRRLHTYDTSKTPKLGEHVGPPRRLADVDLALLKELLAGAVERAQQEDPELLRGQIADLQQQLRDRDAVRSQNEPTIQRIEVPVEVLVPAPYVPGEIIEEIEAAVQRLQGEISHLTHLAQDMRDADSKSPEQAYRPQMSSEQVPGGYATPVAQVPSEPAAPTTPTSRALPNIGNLTKGATDLLEVMVRRHPMQLTLTQLATLAHRSTKSSSFKAQVSELKQRGLVVQDQGLLRLSDDAQYRYADQLLAAKPQSAKDLIELWRHVLPEGPRKMLDVVISKYPAFISKDDLARAAGFSPKSSSVGAHIGTLKRNGLVELNRGSVRASSNLCKE